MDGKRVRKERKVKTEVETKSYFPPLLAFRNLHFFFFCFSLSLRKMPEYLVKEKMRAKVLEIKKSRLNAVYSDRLLASPQQITLGCDSRAGANSNDPIFVSRINIHLTGQAVFVDTGFHTRVFISVGVQSCKDELICWFRAASVIATCEDDM